jgi:hypothetical protein
MPSLLEIWEKGELKKYPQLPEWCIRDLGGPNWMEKLSAGNKFVERVADLLWYDEYRKVWDRSMED